MDRKLKLFVDSASDLPQYYRDKYNISIVPLSVIFGEAEFKDQIDISTQEFWELLLKADTLPSTNQVNPHEFVQAFEPHLAAGEEILYIGLSSQLSGTLQSAHIAKRLLNSDRVHIFDSKSASIGVGLLAIRAGELREEGKDISEIWQELEKDRADAFGNFIVDSLTHLVKGGRLTKTQGLVGSMLNIKPILAITAEGTIEPAEKVRSTKKALQTIVAKAKETNIDFSHKRVAVVHTYNSQNVAELVDMVKTELGPKEIVTGLIGSTIGTHAGPGGVALIF